MWKLTWIVIFATFPAVLSAADNPIPDLRGTWKGESESIVLGAGNPLRRAEQELSHLLVFEPDQRTARILANVCDDDDGFQELHPVETLL